MKLRLANTLFAAFAGAGMVFLVCAASFSTVSGTEQASPQRQPAQIWIDYPLEGTVFPPEITSPTFLWHDAGNTSRRWVIEVKFADDSNSIRIDVPGERFHPGEADPNAGPGLAMTEEQASALTWTPDADTWIKIKRHSVASPASISIQGFADGDSEVPIAAAKVSISTSTDPVGAPVFYRDVPLMLPSPDEKGPIAPLPRSAIPLIKWQIRNIAESKSHLVMTNLPTCANCHSFSRDGKTFGLDLDGPRNDKGLYALVPVSPKMTIQSKNVIHWSSFQLNNEAAQGDPAVKRFGFMSQVSPDGRFVVTSIGPPDNTNKHQSEEPGFASGILDRLYSTNYKSIQFSQVFYPTRGILAWYDRKQGTMRPLPGADNPEFVHTSAFWSPDGKYLIFSRAVARDPYPAGVPKPQYANDPNETQIQYDLYKIPFNDGKGGKALAVEGASGNGMSNNFPKVSPDGKWIVFVQNKNGLLMRPDSKLYIVPFAGGKARLMKCNLSLMNSWHTFSPNGHWLAFSSKARGPYTRLMLTHIDADGNDTPAVIVDDTTASNRAVNIPEFVNVAADGGLESIDPQATDFYRLFDEAFKLLNGNQISPAIEKLREAIKSDPDDALVHYVLATALSGNDKEVEALEEYKRAVALGPRNPTFVEHLAVSLALNGDTNGAVDQLQKAIAIEPNSVEYRFNLGYMLESQGDFAGAVSSFEKAVQLSRGKDWRCLAELAKVYDKVGRSAEAARSAELALDLAVKQNNVQVAQNLRDALKQYERRGGVGQSQ